MQTNYHVAKALKELIGDVEYLMDAYHPIDLPDERLLAVAKRIDLTTIHHPQQAEPFKMTPKVALTGDVLTNDAVYDVVNGLNQRHKNVQVDAETLSETLKLTIYLTHSPWQFNKRKTLICVKGKTVFRYADIAYRPQESTYALTRYRDAAYSSFDMIRQLILLLEHDASYVKDLNDELYAADVKRYIRRNEYMIIKTWHHLCHMKDHADFCATPDGKDEELDIIHAELGRLQKGIAPFGFELELQGFEFK